jgi:hypothetical protein
MTGVLAGGVLGAQRGMINRHSAALLNTATALGYVLLLAGIFADGQVSLSDLRAAGFGLIICGPMRSATAIWGHGRQRGYDDGYEDGRRVARPVVIPITRIRDRLVSEPMLLECPDDLVPREGG